MAWIRKAARAFGRFGKRRVAPSSRQSELPFFTALFSLLAKLAKADGVITTEEIRTVERIITNTLNVKGEKRLLAIKIFRSAKDSPRTFEQFAEDFRKLFHDDLSMLTSIVDILLAVSLAELRMTNEKRALIRKAVRIFGLDERDFERLQSRYPHSHRRRPGTDHVASARLKSATFRTARDTGTFRCADPYRVLGCAEGADEEELKRAYRRLALRYHPDRMVSRGLPPQFQRFAERRFREVQAAYEQLVGSSDPVT